MISSSFFHSYMLKTNIIVLLNLHTFITFVYNWELF